MLEFQFPSTLPHRDPVGGIVFGEGGARGVFQAGVVHAFAMSGYFPATGAGTGVGCLSATVLALASEIEDQRERMRFVQRYVERWLENPTAQVFAELFKPGTKLRRLLLDLADIKLDLGELATIAADLFTEERRLPAAFRLLRGLPLRPRLAYALIRAIAGATHGAVVGDPPLRAAGQFLAAYGVHRSLLPGSPVDFFEPLLSPELDRLGARVLGDLRRTRLLFQLGNISQISDATRGAKVLTIGPQHGAAILPTLGAAGALAPFFAGRRIDELVQRLPEGTRPGDIVLNASTIDRAPIAPLVSDWRGRSGTGPFRLFAVYHSPIQGPSIEPPTGFLETALRGLHLSEQRDLEFNAKATRLISELTETLESAGVPVPRDDNGHRYQQIHTTAIAPDLLLPLSLSAPTQPRLQESAAAGCRAGLEALHAHTLRELARDRASVACPSLLATLRRRHGAKFFTPVAAVCHRCPARLEPPVGDTLQPKTRPEFVPIPGRSGGDEAPLTIAVPAGGVFLGVFQIGTVAALLRYRQQPELYAGASVGTLFSYVMAAAPRLPGLLTATIELMETLPEWVDGRNGGRGRVDRVVDALKARFFSDAAACFRSMRPRAVVELFSRFDSTADAWDDLETGLNTILFEPLPDRRTGKPRELAPAGLDQRTLRKAFHGLLAGRLDEALEIGDKIAAHLDLFDPGAPLKGELIGLDDVAAKMSALVFGDANPTLEEHAQASGVRFLFTVADLLGGEPIVWGRGESPSANAVEASLAASSLPFAFRPRSEVDAFGSERSSRLFIDGGIFNNFPSDAAFAFLRRHTARPELAWLGAVRHRALLLSLATPPRSPKADPHDDNIAIVAVRSLQSGNDEKVYKTWTTQRHINRLAELANPILREQGKPQAVIADFDLIAPVTKTYSHPFAFKEYFGFDLTKQHQMLAAGCRRTRVALEWREYRSKRPAWIDEFNAAVAREWTAGCERDESEGRCIFGPMTPEHRRDQALPSCGFLELDAPEVFKQCRATAHDDPPLRRLPLYQEG